MGMTALQLCQEVAQRMGMIKPITLLNAWSSDPTAIDKNVSQMLACVNAAARNAMVYQSWHEAAIVASFNSHVQEPGGISTQYMLEDQWIPHSGSDGLLDKVPGIAPFFDSMLSLTIASPAANDVVGAASFDDFMTIRLGRSGVPTTNGYLFKGTYIDFAKALPFIHATDTTDATGYEYQFMYKTYAPAYGIQNDKEYPSAQTKGPKIGANKDEDTFILDDELIVLGAMVHFKGYLNMNAQVEQANYAAYLAHLTAARGSTGIIQPHGHVLGWNANGSGQNMPMVDNRGQGYGNNSNTMNGMGY